MTDLRHQLEIGTMLTAVEASLGAVGSLTAALGNVNALMMLIRADPNFAQLSPSVREFVAELAEANACLVDGFTPIAAEGRAAFAQMKRAHIARLES